ncbi:MAG: hypothetical protein WKF73_19425 [Nocardioidaceae bacterium]
MSKRLRVVLDDAEFDALREAARQDGMTLSVATPVTAAGTTLGFPW